MKKQQFILTIYCIITLFGAYAQDRWENLSSATPAMMSSVIEDGDFLWCTIEENGIRKINLKTKEVITYTKSNTGLPSNNINVMTIDKKGNKWFGTPVGLVKFDGSNWAVYTTSNTKILKNEVTSLYVSADNILWIGHEGGLTKFDGSNWTTFQNKEEKGLISDIISIKSDSKGNLWFVWGLYGLGKFDGSSWELISTTPEGIKLSYATAIAMDANDLLWLGSGTTLVSYDINSKKWQTFNTSNSTIAENAIRSIAIDSKGAVWVAHDYKFSKYENSAWKSYTFPISPMYMPILHIGKNDVLYMGTHQNFVYSLIGSSWTGYSLGGLNLPKGISIMTVDENNQKWGAYLFDLYQFHELEGVKKYPAYEFQNYSSSIFDFANIVIDKNNNKLVGSNGAGIAKFNGTKWELINTSNAPLPSNRILSQHISTDGTWWVGTAKGLAKFANGEWTTFSVSTKHLPSDSVYSITNDKNGVIWIGTQKGLVKIDGTNWTTYSSLKNNFPASSINFLVYDSYRNVIWLKDVANNTLVSFNGNSYQSFPIGGIAKITLDYDKNVWIATTAGLKKIDFSNIQTSYTTANTPLPDNYITNIMVDNNNTKWIASLNNYMTLIYSSNTQTTQILTQPTAQTINEGNVATFEVKINSTGSYQWQMNNKGSWENIATNNLNFQAEGITSSLLTLNNVTLAANQTKFRCIITTSDKTLTSDEALLTVKEVALSINRQPENRIAIVDKGESFKITTNINQGISYQWEMYVNNTWTNAQTTTNLFSIAGANTSTLSLDNIKKGASGIKFRCIIQKGAAPKITSNDATLTVYEALKITQEPQSTTINDGGTASFSVTVNLSNCTYSWQVYRNNSWVSITTLTGLFEASGQTTSILTLKNINANANNTKIRCFISDGIGIQSLNSSEILLTVTKVLAVEPDDNQIIVFPNPSSSHLHLNKSFEQIELYDILGKKYFVEQSSPQEINLKGISKGLYYLHLTENGKSIVKKIIIE